MKKKWFSLSNIFNALFIVFFLAMVLIPEVKAWTIGSLMKIGLFQPDLPAGEAQHEASSQQAPLPRMLFEDSEGNVIDLAEQKGKVIFINFWATWCPPCIAEMPAISKLYEQFRDNDDVVFIMADMDQNFEKSRAFLKKKGLDLPLYKPVSNLPESVYEGTLPTTVIINKSGVLSFHHEGTADYSNPEVADFIRKLTKEGSPVSRESL